MPVGGFYYKKDGYWANKKNKHLFSFFQSSHIETFLGEGKNEDSEYSLWYWSVTKLIRTLPLSFFIRSNGNFLDDGSLSIRNVQIP